MSQTATKTEIGNMALGHLGNGTEVQNVDEDDSSEAAALRRFFEPALRKFQRDYPFSFTSRIKALTLVETNPNGEWTYSYRYPSDCVELRRILSGRRNDNRQSKVAWRKAQDDDGLLIYCDLQNAEAEYSKYTDNVTIFPPDFVMAFSYLWASLAAASITAGDPYKLGQKMLTMYVMAADDAMAKDSNEEQPDQKPESEFVRARGLSYEDDGA